MEYIYILAIIGYYIYKHYSSAKENEEQLPDYSVPGDTDSSEKGKGIFDTMLEEWKKEFETPAPEYKTPPLTVPIDTHPPVKKPLVERKKESGYKPVEMKSNFQTLMAETEGGRTTEDLTAPQENRPSAPRRFAGMNMTPKEAFKAQIILERKF